MAWRFEVYNLIVNFKIRIFSSPYTLSYLSINLIEICIKKRIETIQKRLSAYKATHFYKYLMTTLDTRINIAHYLDCQK